MSVLIRCSLCVLAVSSSVFAQEASPVVETETVVLKDLSLRVPKTWTKPAAASSMRLATYMTPAATGDAEGAELSIFNFGGGGGGVGANISRWIGQFGGEGRMSTVTKGKAGANEYYLADIGGIYNKPDGPPILRKTKPSPGYRMLGVILVLEGKGVYYLKLTGPEATVKAEADRFRASFSGDVKTEEPFEI
jgi:hypothetical protein